MGSTGRCPHSDRRDRWRGNRQGLAGPERHLVSGPIAAAGRAAARHSGRSARTPPRRRPPPPTTAAPGPADKAAAGRAGSRARPDAAGVGALHRRSVQRVARGPGPGRPTPDGGAPQLPTCVDRIRGPRRMSEELRRRGPRAGSGGPGVGVVFLAGGTTLTALLTLGLLALRRLSVPGSIGVTARSAHPGPPCPTPSRPLRPTSPGDPRTRHHDHLSWRGRPRAVWRSTSPASEATGRSAVEGKCTSGVIGLTVRISGPPGGDHPGLPQGERAVVGIGMLSACAGCLAQCPGGVAGTPTSARAGTSQTARCG